MRNYHLFVRLFQLSPLDKSLVPSYLFTQTFACNCPKKLRMGNKTCILYSVWNVNVNATFYMYSYIQIMDHAFYMHTHFLVLRSECNWHSHLTWRLYMWFDIVIIIAAVVQSPDRRGKGVITVSIKKKVNCLNRRIASSVLCVAYQNGRNAQFGRKCLFRLTLPQQKRTFLHSQLRIEICKKHIKKRKKYRFE